MSNFGHSQRLFCSITLYIYTDTFISQVIVICMIESQSAEKQSETLPETHIWKTKHTFTKRAKRTISYMKMGDIITQTEYSETQQ